MDTAIGAAEQLQLEIETLRNQLEEMRSRCSSAENELHKIQTRNLLLGDTAPFGIFTMDTNGRVTGLNRKMREILSLSQVEINLSFTIYEFQPLFEAGMVANFHECLQERKPIAGGHPCVNTAGMCMHLRYTLSPVLDENGAVTEVLVFVEDITHLKLAENTIRENEDRYRLLFQSAPVAMIERDASQLKLHLEALRRGGVLDFSAYLAKYPEEIPKCMSMIKTIDYNESFLRLIEVPDREALNNGGFLPADPDEFTRMAKQIILMCADGNISREREETIWTAKGKRKNVIVKSLLVTGHEHTYARIVVSLVDITQRKQAEEALRVSERHFREQAMRDILTGLYNRRYLYQSLDHLLVEGKQSGMPVSLIFMDLDDFKKVVDTHGHLNGSRVIQEVAATINETLVHPAYAVAYAGDEFVVVLPGYDSIQAEAKTNEIRSRIRSTPYLQELGLSLHIAASFGIATFPDHADDMLALLASADRALFSVKANGKNTIGRGNRFFNPSQDKMIF